MLYRIRHHLTAASAGGPASDHRRKLSGGPTRHNELDRRRIGELQVALLAVDHRLLVELHIRNAFAGAFFKVSKRNAGVCKQELAHRLPGEAIAVKRLYVFGTEHDHRFDARAHSIRPDRRKRAADRLKDLLAFTGDMFADPVRWFTGEERNGTLVRLETHLDVQGLPRILLFVFGYAIRKLPGVAERGHIDLAGPRS